MREGIPMKLAKSCLTLILAAGIATPALAGSMSMEDIKTRLEAQKDTKKIEPASIRTDDDGNPLSESGYMAVPSNARIMMDVQFKVGSASVTKSGGKQIAALCDAMKAMDNMPSIHLIGHTDRSGKAEKNLEVSQKRAAAVKDYIVENCGLPGGLMLTSGEGEAFASEDGPANNADARRIEVQLIGVSTPEPAEVTPAQEEPAEEGSETAS